MRRTTIAIGLLFLTLGVAAQDEHKGAKVTVQGEILDMACYMAHEAKGAEHAKCAQACVKGGQPMGLLAKDGQLFLLYASHDDASGFEAAKPLAGKQVEVTGIAAKRGSVNGLEVHAVKAL